MQEADRRAINVLGIPGAVLMYNAGRSVADLVLQKYAGARRVGVLAGKGNNGGDGFVVAHLLSQSGIDVRVIALAPLDAYTGDARTFLNVCLRERVDVVFPGDAAAMVRLTEELCDCDVIIDSILGTGARGAPREPVASVIRAIPCGRAVVAVDIPSGMNGDTGEVCGACVRADYTVTFAAAKRGIVGKKETGELVVADIGIPVICFDDDRWNALTQQ